MDTCLLEKEILEALRHADRPLMSKEIVATINNKHGVGTVKKTDVNKAAFSNLKNELVYDVASYTYRLISDQVNDTQNPENEFEVKEKSSQNQTPTLSDEIRLLLEKYNKSLCKKYERLKQKEENREENWHTEIIELTELIAKSLNQIGEYCLQNEITLSSISPYLAEKDYHTILDQVSKTVDSKSTLQVADIKFSSKIEGEFSFNEELLYPLIYNIPLPSHFRARDFGLERKNPLYAKYEKFLTTPELRPALLSAQGGFASDKEWKIIYSALKKQVNEMPEELDSSYRQSYIRLKNNLENPYRNFLLASDAAIDSISFAEENEQFNMLFLEATRDNVITDAERKLLYEKASQYGITTDKLDLALNNQFKAYSSFKVLVDEVCEDGVITEAERHFINEKGTVYNISDDQVEQLLANGLIKAKGISSLKDNKTFYELIIIYLLFDFIDQNGEVCNRINNFIYNYLLRAKEIDSTRILFKKEQMKRILYEKVNEILETDVCSMSGTIEEFVYALKLEAPSLMHAASMEKLRLEEIEGQLDETILAINGNNISFEIQYLPGLRSDSVCNHEMKGNTVFITHGYPNPTQEFKRFLAAHVYTRIQHGGNKTAKKIFNSFNRNLIDFLTNE